MKTTIKSKWFFPAQDKIKNYLNEKFGENYRCEFQDVCKYIVYETYQCWFPKEEGKPQEQERITFVIHKPATKTRVAIIETMIAKYEDAMQFFQDGH